MIWKQNILIHIYNICNCYNVFAIIKIRADEQKKENTTTETKQEETTEVTELKLGVASFDSINPILSKNKNVQDIQK